MTNQTIKKFKQNSKTTPKTTFHQLLQKLHFINYSKKLHFINYSKAHQKPLKNWSLFIGYTGSGNCFSNSLIIHQKN